MDDFRKVLGEIITARAKALSPIDGMDLGEAGIVVDIASGPIRAADLAVAEARKRIREAAAEMLMLQEKLEQLEQDPATSAAKLLRHAEHAKLMLEVLTDQIRDDRELIAANKGISLSQTRMVQAFQAGLERRAQ